MKSKIIILLLSILSLVSQAQTQAEKYTWWNAKHSWDGVTPWQEYIRLSPAFMGPNALPVPEVQEAKIQKSAFLEYADNFYYQSGDYTIDANIKFVYPIKELIQIEAWMVPFEYYNITDTMVRDERAIRYENPEGTASGDLYMGTHIKLPLGKSSPDVVLGFAFKTASGGKLGAARYTDTPGYYFDLSFGHTFKFEQKILKTIRIYAMGGFYAYQTYDHLHAQNDAILYGMGCNLNFKKTSFKNRLGGYYGYLNNGDKPLVFRSEFIYHKQQYDWFLRYQYGINDFPYQAMGLGLRWKLSRN